MLPVSGSCEVFNLFVVRIVALQMTTWTRIDMRERWQHFLSVANEEAREMGVDDAVL